MDHCCQKKGAELDRLEGRQRRVLWVVLVINATMFVVELLTGYYSRSSSLKADALDMLGDSIVYGFSLFVIAKNVKWRGTAALLKGAIMMVFGAAVAVDLVLKLMSPTLPISDTMGIVGAIALAANASCLVLLLRHRADDVNMRSTWICSRNDIVANTGVLIAAGLVALTQSRWPDLVVGASIALLFLSSAFTVVKEALNEIRGRIVIKTAT